MGKKAEELTGRVFGELTVVGNAGRTSGGRRVSVRCSCGTTKTVYAAELKRGSSRSCGCRLAEYARRTHTKHGAASRSGPTPEYRIWHGIVARCTRPSCNVYSRYGGSGIRICDRWRSDFAAFFADMGPRPSPRHSIDRIDGTGDYDPSNCRWATQTEQMRNTRTNHRITVAGQALLVSEWERRASMTSGTILSRLRRGWDTEKAVLTPPQRRRIDAR